MQLTCTACPYLRSHFVAVLLRLLVELQRETASGEAICCGSPQTVYSASNRDCIRGSHLLQFSRHLVHLQETALGGGHVLLLSSDFGSPSKKERVSRSNFLLFSSDFCPAPWRDHRGVICCRQAQFRLRITARRRMHQEEERVEMVSRTC